MRLAPERLALMAITDRRYSPLPLAEQVRRALAGGATIVQFREKTAPAREALALGAEVLAVCRAAGVPMLVNDRVDWALALGADGVHLGQGDMPVAAARRLLGPMAFIGATANRPELVRESLAAGADYVGAGAVFPTPTKTDHSSVIGFSGLAALARETGAPLVAIGGLDAGNADHATRAGARGVAVVSALWAAPDIEAAARDLLAAVRAGWDEARP